MIITIEQNSRKFLKKI